MPGRLRRPAALFLALSASSYLILLLAWPPAPIDVHVRWKPEVSASMRAGLERRFTLTAGVLTEGTTWRYRMADFSSATIRSLVEHGAVDDTAHLNRVRFRPELRQDRGRLMPFYAVAAGAAATIALFAVMSVRRRLRAHPWLIEALHGWEQTTEAPRTRSGPAPALPMVAAVASAAALVCAGAGAVFGASAWRMAVTLLMVYFAGYAVGALLLPLSALRSGLALAVIRTIAGLLLTTTAFLLSLVLSLPWFAGPGLVVAAALVIKRQAALQLPSVELRLHRDGIAAGVIALVLLSPSWLTFASMAPGDFPPVFYNADTPYALEKVHALVAAESYPPPSLGNLGVSRTYHYGSLALAALATRVSGLLAHHSLFLIVLPLLTAGKIAAAFAAARFLAPMLPRSLVVPLLLLRSPSVQGAFWYGFGPQLWSAVSSGRFSMAVFDGDVERWGIVSNVAINVGADFLILAAIAALAAVPAWGWLLPAWLIGGALMVKTTTGVALLAGLALVEGLRLLVAATPWPSRLALTAAAVFVAMVAAFFAVGYEGRFSLEFTALYHLSEMARRGMLAGLAADLTWLLLPAVVVAARGISDPGPRGAVFLLMSLAPLLVVNVTRLQSTEAGGGGTGDDWLQVMRPVPFLLHAFVVAYAARRWSGTGRPRRLAYLTLLAVVVAPVVVAATRYSAALVADPESGYEFVDNRALAAALAGVPTGGTLIVTNDLRHPAGNFQRDFRQMQLPALYGHQGFALNYVYEVVEERRGLQQLLQRPEWSDAIVEAARIHRWTHLVIRKDYPHPAGIPLERVFDGTDYAVYRFVVGPPEGGPH